MRAKLAAGSLSAIVLSAIFVLSAGRPTANEAPYPPSIEGTYKLVSRELPDGTKQVPPEILGLLTYTKEHRNFNVYWTDAVGKRFSISAISAYKLTETEYSETNLLYVVNDEIGGSGAEYDLSSQTGTSPVSWKDGRLEFDLPLHGEPRVTFAGDKMTATREGEFIDHWERVR